MRAWVSVEIDGDLGGVSRSERFQAGGERSDRLFEGRLIA
jgi:hypothetical protein